MGGPNHLERLIRVGKRFGKGFTISATVGDWAKGAKNVSDDVETVQLLLEVRRAETRAKRTESQGRRRRHHPPPWEVQYCQGDPRVSAHVHDKIRRPRGA